MEVQLKMIGDVCDFTLRHLQKSKMSGKKEKKKKGSSDFFSSRLFGSLIKVFKVSSEQGFPDLLVFVSPLHSPGVFNQ